MSEVIIKQLVDNEGNPIAGLTPEEAVFDQNGVRLKNKLESIDEKIEDINYKIKTHTGKGGVLAYPTMFLNQLLHTDYYPVSVVPSHFLMH